VARRIYKGIPEKMRGLVWSFLLGVEQEAKKNAGVYEVFYICCMIIMCSCLHIWIHIHSAIVHVHGYLMAHPHLHHVKSNR